jgi:RNA polymerase sigma factor (sigma-70 family)
MDRESLLIKRTCGGDEEAFSEIIDIYKNYIFAIILNFIKDYDEAENVAQEVFYQIYVSLNQFDNINFKAWISRIATNKSIDWIRKRKSRFREEILENSEGVIDIVGSSERENPEILLVEKENKEVLNKALNSIPEIYREAIEKFYFKEMTYEEIAKEEDVTVKTIASRLYRGKNLLREKWREENEAL